ncbi:MAG: polyketide beta-ketoacyl:ACP synthase [Candidatus Competibacteraceae bacterium]|nr:polyketide beta-ketoacyl:ACP synthase [Candidatus Competibacteraceae bacterium]MCB1821913.1 polyketide beta-ketoacyl:ACP synthase [Candidatus Competibacteraceae bacterium]
MTARPRLVVTGLGARASIAANVPELAVALRAGRCGFGVYPGMNSDWPGFWLPNYQPLASFTALPPKYGDLAMRAQRALRGAPIASQVAAEVALEALAQAGLLTGRVDNPALIVAGNNIHQHYAQTHYRRFLEQPDYLNPRYAVNFVDTGVMAALSEIFGLHGPGFTVGGSAASGNVALYQAAQLLRAGATSTCLCVGPLADFGDLERQALVNLGVLNDEPACGCRPFDQQSAGMALGHGSAALVLETLDHAQQRQVTILAELSGIGLTLDGRQGAEPDVTGEARAMRLALADARLDPSAIDTLNAHGTGTPVGDAAECAAVREVFDATGDPIINASKALFGHCFFAAGLLEAAAVIVQIQHGFLHPNPFLEQPVAADLRFAGLTAEPVTVHHALSNAFSFGGINSSVAISRYST